MAKDIAFDSASSPIIRSVRRPKAAGFFRRLAQSIAASRQRAAEREIERFIRLRGGTLTDELEREISRKFGGPAGY